MKWLSTSFAAVALLAGVARADVPLGEFAIAGSHGNIASGNHAGQPILARSFDRYELQTDALTRSDEREDTVVSRRVTSDRAAFECRNRRLGILLTKTYSLTEDGALTKTIAVQPLATPSELHVYSVVTLDPGFRRRALYYTPRQSWPPGPPERQLCGVQPAAQFTQDTVSASVWDNRLVVGFLPTGGGLGHYRFAVNGRHVMPSGLTGRFYGGNEHGLTYTPTGWRFEALHMLEGDRTPVSATMHYALTSGDFLDILRHFRAQPAQHALEGLPVPAWCSQVKVASLWTLDPPNTGDQIAEAHAAAGRLGGAYLPLGFGWGYGGDYDTDGAFINEFCGFALSAGWVKRNVAAFQRDPHVRIGMYIQGMLIDSLSKAFTAHPAWAITDAQHKPMFSDFRDNPAGSMYYVNPLDLGWVGHYLTRVKAMCAVYRPGWIYCDGGTTLETNDYRARRAILPDAWDRLYERQWEVTHASSPDRAVLLNAQNFPHADMYWLECSYFGGSTPWRETVDFCYDSALLRTPQRPVFPLYWGVDENRYLAMCVAFGFTPATVNPVSFIGDKGWRAIAVAYAMRRGEVIPSSQVTAPVWWRDDTPRVCFPVRVGDLLVVPVMNFGSDPQVEVTVALKAAGMKVGSHAWLVDPFVSGRDQDLGRRPAGPNATFQLEVPTGFGGTRLLVLGDHKLL